MPRMNFALPVAWLGARTDEEGYREVVIAFLARCGSRGVELASPILVQMVMRKGATARDIPAMKSAFRRNDWLYAGNDLAAKAHKCWVKIPGNRRMLYDS